MRCIEGACRSARILALVLTGVAGCGPALTEKGRYTLLHPTPRAHMREMSTDRPDATESPYTVDAGHVQVELSLFDLAHDQHRGVETTTLAVLPSNLKLGVLNDVDVQLVLTPYLRESIEGEGDGDDASDGFGDDTQIRVKVNLWGNDGPGPSAMAIMPFVEFPTGSGELSNDHVEAGLILPYALALPAEIGLGLMAEVDLVWDDETSDYDAELLHTAEVGRDVPGIPRLGSFVEYIGVARDVPRGAYQTFARAGLAYALSDDWVLDCGATLGITADAEDVSGFVGMSFRR